MSALSRRHLFGLAAVAAVTPLSAVLAVGPKATVLEVYRSPYCGCCGDWIAHMRDAGFQIDDRMLEDMTPLKAGLGVPEALQSCHTAVIDGYVIEGHVPAADVQRLLRDRPAAIGLAVPGMPAGSPGMEMGGASDAYDVIQFAADNQIVFSSY